MADGARAVAPDAASSARVEPEAEDERDLPRQGLGLAARMKAYEEPLDHVVDPNLPFIIRLDGHKFSKFTKGFRKPFDVRLHRAMVRSACDVLSELRPTVAYTQSDEITFVFFPEEAPAGAGLRRPKAQVEGGSSGPGAPAAPECKAPDENPAPGDEASAASPTSGDKAPAPLHQPLARNAAPSPNLIFNGRIQKLVSLAASLCAVRFNHYLMQEDFGPADAKIVEKVRSGRAYFDGRCFNVPSREEAVNNLLWRSLYDCVRNSRLNLGLQHYSPSAIHGLKTADLILKLEREKGVVWGDMSNAYKYGTFIKKHLVEKQGMDPRTGETKTVFRGRILAQAFQIRFCEEALEMISAKYWGVYPKEDVEAVWDQGA